MINFVKTHHLSHEELYYHFHVVLWKESIVSMCTNSAHFVCLLCFKITRRTDRGECISNFIPNDSSIGWANFIVYELVALCRDDTFSMWRVTLSQFIDISRFLCVKSLPTGRMIAIILLNLSDNVVQSKRYDTLYSRTQWSVLSCTARI